MNNKISQAIITVIALIAIVLSIVAVNKKTASNIVSTEEIGTLEKIQKTSKMDVCYAVYPPAVIKNPESGELSGHDIDAIELIASRINAKVSYHEQTFGNMAAALQSGKCDLTTSYFAQIPRASSVAFTKPLFYVGDSALAQKGDIRFTSVEDVDKKGIKIAVATGESGHNYVKENFKNAEIIAIDVESSDLSRFLLEVTSGRVDIGIADANTIGRFAKTHPETEDVFAGNPFNLNPNNYAVRQGDLDFLNFMNTALDYLMTSGEFEEFEEKYDAHWLHEKKEYMIK